MRKIFFALTLCIALSATSVQAQSLDALLKSLTSLLSATSEEPAKAPKITHPEAYDLMGRWYFEALVMDYTGDSSIAAVAVSTLEGQLPLLASKFDLVVGRDYINIGEDGVITFACGDSRISAHCNNYDSYNGEVTMTFYLKDKYINVTGLVLVQDGKTKVLFDANKIMELLSQHYPNFKENTTLQMAKTVIDSYPGIRVGAAIKK